jgi:trimethylamine--corrinoid protein Co-methyltransferase
MKNMKSHVEILSPEEILMIHQAALRVLSRIGFHMPNDECLRRCVKSGAKVDFQTQIVRIPAERMEEVIVMLKPALEANREHTPKLAGGISTQVFVVDYLERTRRYGRMDDIMKGIAMLDHLPNIPSCNATTVPADVDSRISDVATYNLLLKYSAKAGGTYVINPVTAQYILDMGDVMGRKEFYLFETISPLKFRPETLEMGLTFADRGHALGIAPMIVGGSTGPATMAGTMTLVVAEILASLFSVYAISGQCCAPLDRLSRPCWPSHRHRWPDSTDSRPVRMPR